MFNKKKCKRCNSKISKEFDFCPYCGSKEDGTSNENKGNYDESSWGMLGRNDLFPTRTEIELPFGFNTLFKSLMKNLDSQFKEMGKGFGREFQENKKIPKEVRSGGISISISTSNNGPPEIRVKSSGNIPEFRREEEGIKKQLKPTSQKALSEGSLKKFSKLPRQEPNTNVRRLSNKVVYEIDLPGVKTTNDISIIKLENSIEIKAVSKDKAYFKLIPINIPIKKYFLKEEKLILELEAK